MTVFFMKLITFLIPNKKLRSQLRTKLLNTAMYNRFLKQHKQALKVLKNKIKNNEKISYQFCRKQY